MCQIHGRQVLRVPVRPLWLLVLPMRLKRRQYYGYPVSFFVLVIYPDFSMLANCSLSVAERRWVISISSRCVSVPFYAIKQATFLDPEICWTY